MKQGWVHGEHWDIDPMIEVPTTPTRRRDETSRTRPIPSAEFGLCPMCHSDRRIGLVRVGKHLVWRVHERKMMSGAHAICPASGTTLCVTPSRGLEMVSCPHL